MAVYSPTGELRLKVNERIARSAAQASPPDSSWFTVLDAADKYDVEPSIDNGNALAEAAHQARLSGCLSSRRSCLKCGSDKPHLHPAVQHEGEVSLCNDPFHLVPTPENTPDKRAALLSSLANITCKKQDADLGMVEWKCFWCEKIVQVVVQFITRDGGKWASAPSGWLFTKDGSEETYVCSKPCLDEIYTRND